LQTNLETGLMEHTCSWRLE